MVAKAATATTTTTTTTATATRRSINQKNKIIETESENFYTKLPARVENEEKIIN